MGWTFFNCLNDLTLWFVDFFPIQCHILHIEDMKWPIIMYWNIVLNTFATLVDGGKLPCGKINLCNAGYVLWSKLRSHPINFTSLLYKFIDEMYFLDMFYMFYSCFFAPPPSAPGLYNKRYMKLHKYCTLIT